MWFEFMKIFDSLEDFSAPALDNLESRRLDLFEVPVVGLASCQKRKKADNERENSKVEKLGSKKKEENSGRS